MSGPTKLKILRRTHARLDLAYVAQLRAMYKGGRALLQDPAVMRRVFPKHTMESEASYKERCLRAFYDNDFALMINKISAMLAADPYVFDDGGKADGKEGDELPEYWKEIQDDARPPTAGGTKRTFDQQLRTTITEAMVMGWAWTLCDLPSPELDEAGNPVAISALDQERAKADRAYPVPYRVDQVLDWREKGGRLLWVRTYEASIVGDRPEDDVTEYIRHTWKVWDDQEITTYVLELDSNDRDRDKKKWDPDDLVSPEGPAQRHTFGVVPWIRCDFDGDDDDVVLWLGDMIEGRCRGLFNLANGDEWLRARCNYQQLYEFTAREYGGPDDPISENQENPGRAGRSMGERAPDIIQVRGSEDDAKYVSPDVACSAINRQALTEGREAIPRVTGQLALASDTSGAVLKRSGDSKAQDKVSEKVLAGVIGTRGRAHGDATKEMLARGRKEDPSKAPASRGYENFDTEDAASAVEEHVALATAPIKSATFQIEHQVVVARTILGDAATPEVMKKVRDELTSTVTQESIAQASMPPVPPGHELDKTGTPVPLPTSAEQAKQAAELKAKNQPPPRAKK